MNEDSNKEYNFQKAKSLYSYLVEIKNVLDNDRSS